MGLTLIGTGVSFDLTLAGFEALKSCDNAYIETYTNPIDQNRIQNLEQKLGKKIELLSREQLESSYLVNIAKSKDICLLVSGDPLTATTHITLLIDAKEMGVGVHVIHNSSIYSTAPARCGLQIYRFGKTASLVNPRPNYKPTSSLEIIRENLKRDLHSLVLLDTEPKPMEAKNALEMLSEFDSAIVLSCVASDEEKIIFGKINEIKNKSLGKAPFTIIIPAKLHPVEEDYLLLKK